MKINLFINLFMLFLISFSITGIIIPIVMIFLNRRYIFDKRTKRKIHRKFIPTLGGIAVIFGIFISQLFYIASSENLEISFYGYGYLLFCSILLFVIGIVDDLIDLKSTLKFIIQCLVSIIVIWKVGLFINLEIYGLSVIASYFFSIFIILFFINAYNFIDGIDGIASMLGILYFIFFSVLSYSNGFQPGLMLSVSVIGALLSFLFYNKYPAKIFMGDSGTLIIGFFISFFIIRFYDAEYFINDNYSPIILAALLIYPIVDTIRVIFLRLVSLKSPFRGDRKHIHYKLIDCGYSHMTVSLSILFYNIVGLSFLLLIRLNLIYQIIFLVLYIILGFIFIKLMVSHRLDINKD